jgi:hypothetical protein
VLPHCSSKDADIVFGSSQTPRENGSEYVLHISRRLFIKLCFHWVCGTMYRELEDDFDLFAVVLSFKQPKQKVS